MTQGNHTTLILAHEDEAMLRRLVHRMSKLGPVFVHVDAKTDISHWDVESVGCTVLSKRVRVFWGDWSMVEATTLLLEAALGDPSNSRFSLISGSNYPIVSNDEIARRAQLSSEIIGSRPAPNMPDGSRPESQYQRRFYKTRRPHTWWASSKNGFMNRVIYYGRPLDWKAVSPSTGMRAGESYWSIEREFAQYCVDRLRSSSPLISYFKKIVCSDEKVFATLYGEYSGQIGREGTTLSKWSGGPNPRPITRDDIVQAISEGHFWFARKFSSQDAPMLDWLDGL
jgi:Core-2/I-Branching enzyme